MPKKLKTTRYDENGNLVYSRAAFAARIGVNVCTVLKWERSGQLLPAEIKPSGRRLYTEEQAVQYFRCNKKWKHTERRV